MTKEWTILLVSAGTDFVITVGTALTAAMVAQGGEAQLPGWPVVLLSVIGGIVAFSRTVQQYLKKQVEAA